MDRKWLEERLRELPVVQYEFFDTAELTFTPRVRMVCETDCARYGTCLLYTSPSPRDRG